VIAPLVLAQICADAYVPAPAGFDNVWEFSGTHLAHRKIGEVDVIVFRGSLDAQDWMDDAFAVPLWDVRLGFVHAGFMCGMNDAYVQILMACGKNIVVTGHSLGGARARILAALLAYAGRPVLQCCVFGSPKPGFVNLSRILQKSGTPVSYRNRNDPVPLVPGLLPPLCLLWAHPDQWIALDSAPPPNDLEPLRDHHMAHYLDGLGKLNTPIALGVN
jgi:pimeloyl-ACP methyl ester carboxylesterase